jgi:3-hydroxybutyryl-CoA dehydrogenase
MESAPQTVVVVGGGRMGSGIAQVFLGAGSNLLLMDVDQSAGARAIERVRQGLEVAIARGWQEGSITEAVGRLRQILKTDEIPAETDLVVEAVPEIPELKSKLLADISNLVSPNTVIASNTSSISINSLASVVSHPERFVGAHFFNPVPKSRMVEVVKGSSTSEKTVTRTVGWVASLGKESVIVRDSPGFASSRLGVLLGLEAIRMLEDGVADAESIDRAMTLGYAHAMGPLRSTDLVGLDVRLAIAEYLQGELGDRFEPPQLLRDLVAQGRLGRKSGHGFFDWT